MPRLPVRMRFKSEFLPLSPNKTLRAGLIRPIMPAVSPALHIMTKKHITFQNASGQELAGILDLPDNPCAFALFAHCFTCGKDVKAAARISRALQARGVAVMRFDFTGLGASEGDFADSNFTSNVTDLLAAADFLRREYQAPALLIGHSLGGAAVLAAAQGIPEARAVTTIAAPAEPSHVLRQFRKDLDAIRAHGESAVSLAGRQFTIKRQFLEDVAGQDQASRIARLGKALLVFHSPQDAIRAHGESAVSLAGRQFTIKRQFLEDVAGQDQASRIARLGKALLVFHSPQDATVAIEQAQKIYEAARHPKSFISLDGADHLLSRAEDAEYVASCIVAWASRYLDPAVQSSSPEPKVPAVPVKPDLAPGHVLVTELNHQFLRGLQAGRHTLVADEPEAMGGTNLGPDPYTLLLSALGTCTSMTIRMYANRKGLQLDDVKVELHHRRITRPAAPQASGAPNGAAADEVVDILEREITLAGNLTDAERQRVLEIADRCPVHRTLTGHIEINTRSKD